MDSGGTRVFGGGTSPNKINFAYGQTNICLGLCFV